MFQLKTQPNLKKLKLCISFIEKKATKYTFIDKLIVHVSNCKLKRLSAVENLNNIFLTD